MILLDTNVVSEAMRTDANLTVLKWLDRLFSESAISTVTLFELNVGVKRMPSGARRSQFEGALEKLVRKFGPRIFAFDIEAARAAANLHAMARAKGLGVHQLPQNLADLQIAGIAVANGLSLATRNTADFDGLGIALINPWA